MLRAPSVLILIAASAALAQDAPAAVDALVAVADADPLDLGRVARRLGDDAVLARLEEDRPPLTRVAAARACLFLRAPEAALPRLAELVASRDADVSVEAVWATLRIATALSADDLTSREHDPASLEPVRARLETLAGDEHLRPDLRRQLTVAADALSHLSGGVHAPAE